MKPLDEALNKFIAANINQPIAKVALLLAKHRELDKTFVLNQINGYQKAVNKLPKFAKSSKITYPTPLSLEQCSSETTAKFKVSVVAGNSLLDLTGGFGVDAYYFSKKFNSVTYIEQNKALFNVATSNFVQLDAKNITCYCVSAEDYLKTNTKQFDVVYIDPARRNEAQKVFQLEDCSPPVLDLLPKLMAIASNILIKTSPMLDIKKAIIQLKFVSEVIVLSIKNECKEVLYLLKNKPTAQVKLTTINIGSTTQIFSFTYADEESALTVFSSPQTYLYESNSAILKAGGFKIVASKFNVQKLALHSHLYTSEKHVDAFPGRCFKITNVMAYQPKLFFNLNLKKANVSCRNFIENVELVKKKLNIKDGGDVYIFATTLANKKPVLLICEKI